MSKDKEDLSRQGRKLLAQLTEYMPLSGIPTDALQSFIEGRGTAAKWLAEQIRLYPHISDEKRRIIDCGVTPTIPLGWRILPEDQLPNRFAGVMSWNTELQASRLVDRDPRRSISDTYRDVHSFFKCERVLPANVLDHLSVFPEDVPETWRGRIVHFLGTVYRTEKNQQAVRCLVQLESGWGDTSYCIAHKNADRFLPAAIA